MIQDYADMGFCVFPLVGKRPKHAKSWLSTEYDALPEIEGNFGVILGEDDLVIDIDPRNFSKSGDTEKAFFERFPSLLSTKTLVVETGSGGKHVYLKKPKDVGIMGGLKEFPGIEFKKQGNYVVGAGSTHPDTGRVYKVIAVNPIVNAPEDFISAITRQIVVKQPRTADYVTDVATKIRFSRFLETAPLAVEGLQGDNTTFTVAAYGHDLGLHPDHCLELMLTHYNPRCIPQWSQEDLRKKVYNAYQYTAGALGNASPLTAFDVVTPVATIAPDVTSYGTLKPTLKNTVLALSSAGSPFNGCLGFNEFSGNLEFLKPAPWKNEANWSDDDAILCKDWLSRSNVLDGKGFEPPVSVIKEAALVVAKKLPFHPVKDYLDAVASTWDGTERLHRWVIDLLGAEDNIYSRTVGLKFLVAAVTRIYEPGTKFDYILVFEGDQGIGKSTVFSILAGKYFLDSKLDLNNMKDTVMYLRSKWIVEFSEMETHRKSDEDVVKAFLSRCVDLVRLPYQAVEREFPRHCVFAGTINPNKDADHGYLKDSTGNRRYWPLKLGSINLDGLRLVRDQLWAEAVLHYRAKTKIFLEDSQLEKLAREEQEKRLSRDPWKDPITRWLDSKGQPTFIEAIDIFIYALGGNASQFDRRISIRISAVMHSLGYTKGTFYDPLQEKSLWGFKKSFV